MKKINKTAKHTLSISQLKKLVYESTQDFEIKGDVLVSYRGNEDYVDVPNGVREIGNEAFRKSRVVTVTIPYSVTSIGENAFYGCSNLVSVSIPRSVTNIGAGAFNGCSKLEVVDIPGAVGSIKKYTFCGCTNLESVHLPKSVTHIEDWAFEGCIKLTDINIPDNADIESKAFYHCKTIPSNMKKINENTKVTLTLGQLKRLVKEAVDDYDYIRVSVAWKVPEEYEDDPELYCSERGLPDTVYIKVPKDVDDLDLSGKLEDVFPGAVDDYDYEEIPYDPQPNWFTWTPDGLDDEYGRLSDPLTRP